ncbi:MAG TPA: exodeoxyribonuclease VII large subunit [Candidatus Kapabacteria bacterium]|nr:exodeoxyribonuclease VII large subunit [Candidatus Kapabacteria bacterium]
MPEFSEADSPLFAVVAAKDNVVETPEPIQTVSVLTKQIKDVLESRFIDVTVEGEISNYTNHRSGHRYFTLKDSDAQISCVFWKSRTLSFELEAGQKVICRGRLSVYAPRGTYQLDVFQIRPVGVGALQLAFERLFKKLQGEGLFDESRKRELPKFPNRIGIVTSATGAAIHDILTVLRRRYPIAEVLLRPASVQGIGSELQVAQAIQEFNILPAESRPDILIVGRGGGSLEDLWTFNEEAVARAIFASSIPIVSAVGHEVDVTIADFVADLRAPTPTAAAELITPDKNELLSIFSSSASAIQYRIQTVLSEYQSALQSHRSGYGLKYVVSQALENCRNELRNSSRTLNDVLERFLERAQFGIERSRLTLKAIDPKTVLSRGYAIIRRSDGTVISSATDIGFDSTFIIILQDGEVRGRGIELK